MMDLSKGVPGARKHGEGKERRALLQRATIVAGILLVMLLGLLLTSGDEESADPPAESAASAPAPLPRLNAQRPELAAPLTSATPAPPAAADAAAAPVPAGDAPAADASPKPSSSPAPAPSANVSSNMTAAPTPASVSAKGADSSPIANPAGPSAARTPVAREASAETPRAVTAGAATGGARIQLGEFGRVDKALGLARTLVAEGMPAGVQRRVVVGPYAGRDAASAAAERLATRAAVKGMVVPARRSGQFLVQAGVFSEARNAEALRARLAAAKFKVVVQGRVVLGPYESRAAAEKALAKVAGKRNIAGTIVSSER